MSALWINHHQLVSERTELTFDKSYRKRRLLVNQAYEDSKSPCGWHTQDLEQTVDAQAEDDALEEFYESIPSFYKSDVVKDLRQCLPRQVQSKKLGTMVGFLRRTLLSNSNPASKNRYINAASEVNNVHLRLYGNVVSGSLRGAIQSVELGYFLISCQWEKNSSGPFHLYIQGVIALIVANVLERNDSWVALTVDYSDLSSGAISHTGIACYSPSSTTSFATCFTLIGCQLPLLRLLSDFDIRNALPDVQHDFCALWNEIARESQNSGPCSRHAQSLLYIRPHYIVLHQGADDTLPAFFDPAANFDYILNHLSSDPFCNNPNHRLGQTHLVHEVAVEEVTHHDAPAVTSITIPLRDPIVDPIASSFSPPRSDDAASRSASQGDLPEPIACRDVAPPRL